jgi:hypothetical protein
MKNYDEFRQTVFEKADRYQAKRKTRNKKIIETVSLCSLCLIIGISSYFVMEKGYFEPESADTALTTPTMDTPQAVQTTLSDMPIETAGTTTGAYMTSTTMQTTVAQTTTYACTVCTTAATSSVFTSTAESTMVCPALPENEAYRVCDIVPCTDENAPPSLFVAKEYEALQEALSRDFSQNMPENERKILPNIYDEAFFEHSVLLILHVSDAYPYIVSFEDGYFVYTVEKGEKTSEDSHMFYLVSIEKDDFISATMEGEIS